MLTKDKLFEERFVDVLNYYTDPEDSIAVMTQYLQLMTELQKATTEEEVEIVNKKIEFFFNLVTPNPEAEIISDLDIFYCKEMERGEDEEISYDFDLNDMI